jgi:hypothetical protein
VAKTYALQAADQPLAQGFLRSTTPGGRVDLEEKIANRQHCNFTGKAVFSQGVEAGLWINKYSIYR